MKTKNYKKVISVSVSEEVIGFLKEKANASSYINQLILKDSYMNLQKEIMVNQLIENERNKKLYHEVTL